MRRAALAMASLTSSASAARPLIVMLHGSGDTGDGVRQWIESLAPAEVLREFDWEFPTAKVIPYTMAAGRPSSVWYDRVGGFEPHHPEQTRSVLRSAKAVRAVVDAAVARGVPPAKIAIGGFSMGGNMAYQVAGRYHDGTNPPLGAVFGLSCYATDDSPLHRLAAKSGSAWPATYVAHGDADDFILPAWGRATFDRLKGAGVDAFWRGVPGARHEMTAGEVAELLTFLKAKLGAGGGSEL